MVFATLDPRIYIPLYYQVQQRRATLKFRRKWINNSKGKMIVPYPYRIKLNTVDTRWITPQSRMYTQDSHNIKWTRLRTKYSTDNLTTVDGRWLKYKSPYVIQEYKCTNRAADYLWNYWCRNTMWMTILIIPSCHQSENMAAIEQKERVCKYSHRQSLYTVKSFNGSFSLLEVPFICCITTED